MFEQTFVDGVGKTNKSWTVFVSFGGQMAVVAVLVLIPLIWTEALPKAQLTSSLIAPPPPPPQVVKVIKVAPRQFDANRLIAPKTIPKEVAIIREEELPPSMGAGVVGGVPGAGVPGGVIGAVISAAAPPPPPAAKAPPPPQRVRVGGNVKPPKLIHQVQPVYPPLAKSARVQGVVSFTGVIGKDGTIQNLQIISGHPLLRAAALEAVKQWIYQPTTLNDEPVEVITQIDVNFTLN